MGRVNGKSVHDEDLDQIFERLAKWGNEVVNVNEEALTEALEIICAAAKQNAPVDTGTLRDSIRIRKRRRGNTVMGTVGSSLDYAPPIEFGTSKMEAQPYLYPAIKNNRARVREIFAKKQRELLKRS